MVAKFFHKRLSCLQNFVVVSLVDADFRDPMNADPILNRPTISAATIGWSSSECNR